MQLLSTQILNCYSLSSQPMSYCNQIKRLLIDPLRAKNISIIIKMGQTVNPLDVTNRIYKAYGDICNEHLLLLHTALR